jgi:ethanolamine utilization protein EutN
MFIGRVTGTVVSTQKLESVIGCKLLLVQALNIKPQDPASIVDTPRTAVALDYLGAGEGELVMVTQGSSARLTEWTKNLPTDAVVVGIIDALQVGEQEIYKKDDK